MKRIFIILLLILSLLPSALAADRTVTAADPNAALDEFLNLPDWPTVEDESNERKGETIYPEEFAGMYAAEDGSLVVCVTSDTPEIEAYYRQMLPNISDITFRTVSIDYNTLQHFMLVIEQRHVSSNLLVVNMYKIKDYFIDFKNNCIDIKLYTDLEYETIEYLHGIFGDAIYIRFCDTTGQIDLYDEDTVRARQTEAEQTQAAETAESSDDSSFAQAISEKAEETGFSVRTVVIPVAIVVVILLVFFGWSKLRSRKTNLHDDDEDYIDK